MEYKIELDNRLLCYNYFNFFNDITEMNVETYYKYMFDLICECDKVLFENVSYDIDKEIEKRYYDKIFDTLDNSEFIYNSHYIYDIYTTECKKLLFNNLKICLCSLEGKLIHLPFNKIYIYESNSLKDGMIHLIKGNRCIISINLFGGFINDRRSWNEIKNQKSELSKLRYNPIKKEISYGELPGKKYRYSTLFDTIVQDSELLLLNSKNKDNGKLEKYLDIYCNYIFDLIDGATNFIVEEMCNLNNFFYYNNYLKNTYYDEIVYKESNSLIYSHRIFDISKEDYRQIFKSIIKFNITDANGDYIKLNISRDYFNNREDFFNNANCLHFIKNNREILELDVSTGEITDYRDLDVIEKHQDKYRELSKNIM